MDYIIFLCVLLVLMLLLSNVSIVLKVQALNLLVKKVFDIMLDYKVQIKIFHLKDENVKLFSFSSILQGRKKAVFFLQIEWLLYVYALCHKMVVNKSIAL